MAAISARRASPIAGSVPYQIIVHLRTKRCLLGEQHHYRGAPPIPRGNSAAAISSRKIPSRIIVIGTIKKLIPAMILKNASSMASVSSSSKENVSINLNHSNMMQRTTVLDF
jgi:hypothetical protein